MPEKHPKRPNILFLMSDEHRYDVAGYTGNEVVRTPFLDWLADTGVVFDNAYCAAPQCIPGRQALMTGCLPARSGCTRWAEDIEPFSMTFAKRFAQYAYHTVCCGKLHHMSPDQMQGWTQRPSGDCKVYDPHIDGRVVEEFARYTPEAGIGKWDNQTEIERAGVGDSWLLRFDRRACLAAHDYVIDHFCSPDHDKTQHHRPLLLKLSLLAPHYPYQIDEARFNYYINRVPIYEEARCDHPRLSRTQYGADVQATTRDIRRTTAAYYGMIENIDTQYSQIADQLAQVGEDLDDWIIVYTSDHGEMLGQHGIWEKTQFYEASVRVPLIIRWPKGFAGGRRINENVSLCDLFATLCDLSGIPMPENTDSRSLAPLLRGDALTWDNVVISQLGDDYMVKKDHLKLIDFSDRFPAVLFDLKQDPHENHNVIDDPAYATALGELKERLHDYRSLSHTTP
ncbi:MAG: DUF4976 domain-containing protein [Planctomycetota bacterium]|nr:MAG: DUF4976 domain-containing protein [Planctomycetota bacterium]